MCSLVLGKEKCSAIKTVKHLYVVFDININFKNLKI